MTFWEDLKESNFNQDGQAALVSVQGESGKFWIHMFSLQVCDPKKKKKVSQAKQNNFLKCFSKIVFLKL